MQGCYGCRGVRVIGVRVDRLRLRLRLWLGLTPLQLNRRRDGRSRMFRLISLSLIMIRVGTSRIGCLGIRHPVTHLSL